MWRLGDSESRSWLQAPGGSVGTIVSDANGTGVLVGAGIFADPTSVRAAAWTFPSADLGGAPEISMVFGPDDLDLCDDTLPDTVLSAVGPRVTPDGSAMVAGIGGFVDGGGWPDGFLGELQAGGTVANVQRLPGTDADEWCDDWPPADGVRSSFGQCIAWGVVGAPTAWSQFWVIGSAHEMVPEKEAWCVEAKLWSALGWTPLGQFGLISYCRGCPLDQGGLEPCAQVSEDLQWHSFATNIRLSSFAPAPASAAMPSALGGLAGVRVVPAGEACNSLYCAAAHAVVALSSGELSQAEITLVDLHSILPDGIPMGPEQLDGFLASDIARIVRWPNSAADSDAPDWIGVGAIGDNFKPGQADPRRVGCLWLGRLKDTGGTEWCAFDVNELTIKPAGLKIEALHDFNASGLAIGVASRVGPGDRITRHLVYLTEGADLNGDLVTDSTDFRLFLAAYFDCSGDSPADLDQDGCVGGSDLALLIGGWGGDGPGRAASVSLNCQGAAWRSPLQRYQSILMAAEVLGFQSLDELGATVVLLPSESALGLCELVDLVAFELDGGN